MASMAGLPMPQAGNQGSRLLDVPEEVLLTILRYCDPKAKCQVSCVCRKLNQLLSQPSLRPPVWGRIVIKNAPRDETHVLKLTSWLLQRAQGIHNIALAFVEPPTGRWLPLHSMLFALAGALEGSGVRLELGDLTARSPLLPFCFRRRFWEGPGGKALASQLTAMKVYQPTLSTHALTALCSLTALEELYLSDEHRPGADGQWVAPDPGLCSLKALKLDGWRAEFQQVLSTTGTALTELSLGCVYDEPTGTLPTTIASLHSLRSLSMHQVLFEPTVRFGSLTALTKFEYFRVDGGDVCVMEDFWWLESFPAIEELILWGLRKFSKPIVDPILALQHLKVLDLRDITGDMAFALGQLRARLSAKRPQCKMLISRYTGPEWGSDWD